ncbi:threonyl-tRNA synthetase editing domain-containing protein [Nocardia stercoris]|nr:threonyl-tRNA synthetase editing domain-containing protein [Nocardia stercoris]
MNILCQRCRTFEYSLTTPGPGAAELDPGSRGQTYRFTDCVFLLVGIEEGDPRATTAAAKAIRRIARKTGATQIVLNGFSHLARPKLRPTAATASQALDALANRLRENGFATHQMPFGWNKSWRADVCDGEWQQRMVYIEPAATATLMPSGAEIA